MGSFTSLKFQNMSTKGHLAQHIRGSHLQGTLNYRNIQLALQSVVSLTNQSGGWTVYGWKNEVLLMTQVSWGKEMQTKIRCYERK